MFIDVKNNMKTDLIFSDAITTCGCTSVNLPKEPINAKCITKIKINFEAHSLGPFSHDILINSNAKNSQVTVKIFGTVIN
jgi:hypothetical protein